MDNAIDLTFSPKTSSSRYALEDLFSDESEEMDGDTAEEEDRKLPARTLTSHNTSPTEASSEEDSSLNRENTIDLTSPLYSRHSIDYPSHTEPHTQQSTNVQDAMDIDEEEDEETTEDERKMPAGRLASSTTYLSDSSDEPSEEDRKIPAQEVNLMHSDSSDEDDVVLCWPCSQCTLVNSNDRSNCEACRLPRSPGSRRHGTSSRPHPPSFASAPATSFVSTTRAARFPYGQASLPPPPLAYTLSASPSPTSGMRTQMAQFITAQRQAAPASFHQYQQAIARMRSNQRYSNRSTLLSGETMRLMLAMRNNRNPDGMSYEQLLQAFGDGTENMGASETAIQQLPVSTLLDPESELPEDRRTCNICLEDFAAGDERRTLPCLHGYHKDCADKWLKTNRTCPVCKHSIG